MSDLKPCKYCTCDQIQWDEREDWVIPFSRYCRNCRTYGPYKKTLEEADEAWNVLMGDSPELIEDIIGALKQLVDLKDYKDRFGKTETYLELQPKAWARARELLKSKL